MHQRESAGRSCNDATTRGSHSAARHFFKAMNTLQTLLDRLEATTLSEGDRELARTVAVDLAGLMARVADGDDPEGIDTELPHIRAQVANLSADAATAFSAEFRRWSLEIVGQLIRAIL